MLNFHVEDDDKSHLKTGDGGLEDRHGEADDCEDDEHVEGARGEVREVQHGVEQLVACKLNQWHSCKDVSDIDILISPAHMAKRTRLSV